MGQPTRVGEYTVPEPSQPDHRNRWRTAIALTVAALGILAFGLAGGPPAVTAAATNHSAPVAVLNVSPNPAHPGDVVRIDATESSDPDGEPVTCAFDLDGDGRFEVETQDCLTDATYEEPAERPLTVRVTDPSGQASETTETLRITRNEPPAAAFTYDPRHPDPGETIRLDAADATDADGEIVEYRWAIEGAQNATRLEGPTPSLAVDTAGEYAITLTVVDDDGTTAATTQVI